MRLPGGRQQWKRWSWSRQSGVTLAVYVAQVGSLAMIAIGLCYVVFARDGAMTSVTAAERIAPVLCAAGIIAEFVAGVAGYYAVAAVWPNFYMARSQPEG